MFVGLVLFVFCRSSLLQARFRTASADVIPCKLLRTGCQICVFVIPVMVAVLAPVSAEIPTEFELVTMNFSGSEPANGYAEQVSVSRDGRFIVFVSNSTNLTPRPVIDRAVYRKDLQIGKTELVSIDSAGMGRRGWHPQISDDGRFIAFSSDVALRPEIDLDSTEDVYVRDMQTGQVRLVSIDFNGRQSANWYAVSPAISGDGRYVAFISGASNLTAEPDKNGRLPDIFVRDLATERTQLASVNQAGNASCNRGVELADSLEFSRNGRVVLFRSRSSDLTNIRDENEALDLFARDIVAQKTHLVTVARDGSRSANYSGVRFESVDETGRFVVYESSSSEIDPLSIQNPCGIYRYDLSGYRNESICVSDGQTYYDWGSTPKTSSDASYILYTGPCPVGEADCWLPTLWLVEMASRTRETVLPNLEGTCCQNGQLGRYALSADGRTVVLETSATNLVEMPSRGYSWDVFARDLNRQKTYALSGSRVSGILEGGASLIAVNSTGDTVFFGALLKSMMDWTPPASPPIPTQMRPPEIFFTHLPKQDRTELFFPGIGGISEGTSGFAFTNLGQDVAHMDLELRDVSGALSSTVRTNPASRDLLPGGQLAELDHELLPRAVGESSLTGWLRVTAESYPVMGFTLRFDPTFSTLDGAVSGRAFNPFVFTEVEPEGFNEFSIANPSRSDVQVELCLRGPDGTVLASALRSVAGMGLIRESFFDLFSGIQPSSGHYVTGESSLAVVGSQYFGRAGKYASVLPAQSQLLGSQMLVLPQSASGEGLIETTLSLVNFGFARALDLNFVRDDGLLEVNRSILLLSGQKMLINIREFFDLPSDQLTTGRIHLREPGLIVGSVRFFDPQGLRFSTALPLLSWPSEFRRRAVFSHVASTATFFTGLAITNEGVEELPVTIELFDKQGVLLISGTFGVPANGRLSQLLTEYFPMLRGQTLVSGYIVVSSEYPIGCYALFGASDLSAMSAIPAQHPY